MIVGARNRSAIVIFRGDEISAVVVVPQHEAAALSQELQAADSTVRVVVHEGPYFCDSAADAAEVIKAQS